MSIGMAAQDGALEAKEIRRRAEAESAQQLATRGMDFDEAHQEAFRVWLDSNCVAARNTSCGVSSFMQRWSPVGQTRSWHGPHGVTTGRSNAAAKWRGPLSVVMSNVPRRTSALVRPIAKGASASECTLG